MKILIFLNILLLSFLLNCRSSTDNSNNIANSSPEKTISTQNKTDITPENTEVFIPHEIKSCISKTKIEEPFKAATFFNPYYLKADFDDNKLVDYAILIKGENTKKNGLIICKDSKEIFVFGAIANQTSALSSFEDDNFITDDWSINTTEETKNMALDLSGKSQIGSKAKGESIGFYFDGGSVFIFWDGKSFQIVEGG